VSRLLRERTQEPPAGIGPAWLAPLRDWPFALQRALEREPVIVRVVLAEVRGSAPREPGAGMLVGREILEGTIGGGALEWQALAMARSMLADPAQPDRLQRLVLGPGLAQCCGGAVRVWIERHTRASYEWLPEASRAARRGPAALSSTLNAGVVERTVLAGAAALAALAAPTSPASQGAVQLRSAGEGQLRLLERLDDPHPPLWLFGAGHVGQALARILMELPLQLTWIDSRAGVFPALPTQAVRVLHAPDPVQCVASAPAGTRFLVLTHSHPLDYALCRAILGRADAAWIGLIGSASKAARFRSRLAREGLSAETIARLVCPIGIDGIQSKWPAAIAVAVAAQLLQDLARGAAAVPSADAMPSADAVRNPGAVRRVDAASLCDEGCPDERCGHCRPHPDVR
jgi:xanthine dehydrogenase accessory factor